MENKMPKKLINLRSNNFEDAEHFRDYCKAYGYGKSFSDNGLCIIYDMWTKHDEDEIDLDDLFEDIIEVRDSFEGAMFKYNYTDSYKFIHDLLDYEETEEGCILWWNMFSHY